MGPGPSLAMECSPIFCKCIACWSGGWATKEATADVCREAEKSPWGKVALPTLGERGGGGWIGQPPLLLNQAPKVYLASSCFVTAPKRGCVGEQEEGTRPGNIESCRDPAAFLRNSRGPSPLD